MTRPKKMTDYTKAQLIDIIESLEKRIAQLEYQASLRNGDDKRKPG